MGVSELTTEHIRQYYERWNENMQTMINCAQNADTGVREIIAMQDIPSIGAVVLTALIDVGLNVALPGTFGFSKAWKTFEAANKARAAAIQAMTSLSGAAKGQVHAALIELDRQVKELDSQSGPAGALQVDALNEIVDTLEKKKASKRRQKETVLKIYFLLPTVNIALVSQMFPLPALLGDASANVRYAFEWMLLKQYVANSVKLRTPQNEWGKAGADEPEGLSRKACSKIFERFKYRLELHEDMPLIGKVLRPVRTFDDLVTIWGARIEPARVFSGMPGNR